MPARCAGIAKILSCHELKLAAQSAQRLIVLVVKEALALLIEAGARWRLQPLMASRCWRWPLTLLVQASLPGMNRSAV